MFRRWMAAGMAGWILGNAGAAGDDAVWDRVRDAWQAGNLAAARAECARIASRRDQPPYVRSYAALWAAKSYLAEGRLPAAAALYGRIRDHAEYPEVHRAEAREMVVEIERRLQGLSPRDPAANRTPVAPITEFHAEVFLAPDGEDAGPGTRDRPFQTLARARDAVRALRAAGETGPVGVTLLPGEYPVAETLQLGREDSGFENGPTVYRAEEVGAAVLYGGRRISGFEPVTDPARLARLPEEARGRVWQCDLKALGVEDFGELTVRGFGQPGRPPTLEVYFDGEPMTLARWPNEGFVGVARVVEPGSRPDGTPSAFEYKSDRHERWIGAEDPWLFGFFLYQWADATLPIGRIDPGTRTLTAAEPYHYGGRGMSNHQGILYYAFNLFEEIDRPGEWYLDRATGTLYLYPPSDPNRAVVEIGMLQEPMLKLDRVSHVRFERLVFDLARGHGIQVTDCEGVLLAGCVVRRMSLNGVMIRGGRRNGLFGCDIHAIGRRATEIAGGDRGTLTPSGHFVENCRIHRFGLVDRTYVPAVHLEGVGARIAYNLIHDAPSSAIRLQGNDHLVEFNEIHSVVTESDDQGAIDMWGNPVYRGNRIRHNFFHQIGRISDAPMHCGQAAIRFDDIICGQVVYGNVFMNSSRLRFGAVQVHAGRENIIDNNVFFDCLIGVSGEWHAGNRHWARFSDPASDYQATELYRSRYPELARMFDDSGVNHLWRNLFIDCGRMIRGNWRRWVLMGNVEREAGEDHGFRDPAGRDFRLRPGGASFERIGFRPIPVEEIGLYEHALRASWPVEAPPVRLPDWRGAGSPARPHPGEPVVAPRAAAIETEPVPFDETPGALVRIGETPYRETVQGPPAWARVAHDGERLLVAVRVPADPAGLRMGRSWGRDDGMEICLRRETRPAAGRRRPPTFVFYGFADGAVRGEATMEEYEHERRVREAGGRIRFDADVESDPGAWVGRWAIPFEAVDLDFEPGLRLQFNIGIRRTGGPGGGEWLSLAGAMGSNSQLDNAARLILE